MYTIALVAVILKAGCSASAQTPVSSAQSSPSPTHVDTKNVDTKNVDTRNVNRAKMEADLALTRRASIISRQGEEAVAQGRVAEGESLFRQALQIQPQHPEALLNLADACERQGKETEALQAYRTLMNPQGWGGSIASDPTTAMRFVLALLRNNKDAEAVEVYDRAMINTMTGIPDSVLLPALARRDMATVRALYAQGHPLLDLRFDPQKPDTGMLQAAAHWVLGTQKPYHTSVSLEYQMQHLQTAIRLRPRWGKAHFALGRMLEDQHQKAKAQAEYSRARELGDMEETPDEKSNRLMNENAQKAHDQYHPDNRFPPM